MLASEKRSLFRFLTIYLSSTFILFFLAVSIFYTLQKQEILGQQHNELYSKAHILEQQLRKLHNTFENVLPYPKAGNCNSAIYNLDKEFIAGTFHPQTVQWQKSTYSHNNRLFYIHTLKPYYLGASFLIVSQEINREPLNRLIQNLALFLLVVMSFFTLLAIFLGKLFTAPMKDSIKQMNRFIEDTTHELNTPISTILTNIELLETIHNCQGEQEMRRIEVASQTLSRLYEDLTYLKFNHNYHREIVQLNISVLLEERLEFFSTLIEAKKLKIEKDINQEIRIKIDRNDAIRLIDNILSNAIKYNVKEGALIVSLNSKQLEVQNAGLGIKKENITLIQKRFIRDNKNEGGFGIGLDIIGQVVKRYQFNFTITSIPNHTTKVTLQWEK